MDTWAFMGVCAFGGGNPLTLLLAKSISQKTKPPPFLMRVCFSGGPTRTWTWDQRIPVCVAFTTPWTMPSSYPLLDLDGCRLVSTRSTILSHWSFARRCHIRLKRFMHLFKNTWIRLNEFRFLRIWHHSHSDFRHLVHNLRYESSALTNWAIGPKTSHYLLHYFCTS